MRITAYSVCDERAGKGVQSYIGGNAAQNPEHRNDQGVFRD